MALFRMDYGSVFSYLQFKKVAEKSHLVQENQGFSGPQNSLNFEVILSGPAHSILFSIFLTF